jgi:competence protein ComEC
MAGTFFRVRERRLETASPGGTRKKSFAQSHLEVRMFNVKDGEAILLVFPGKRAWLIDGGSGNGDAHNQTLGGLLATHLKTAGLKLEVLIPSHAHKDHAGALASLLRAHPRLANKLTLYRSSDAWTDATGWIGDLHKETKKLGSKFDEVELQNQHREIAVASGVSAHLFAGSGQAAYTSVFLHLRYHQTSLLFTGDSKCGYEKKLLARYGDGDFRADVLKVTHHGSSSGTAQEVADKILQGIVIASTAPDGGHRLEQDTLDRLGGLGKPRRVFETSVDGDITLRTDGQTFGNGILYQVELESPGIFATSLGAKMQTLAQANQGRQIGHDRQCK